METAEFSRARGKGGLGAGRAGMKVYFGGAIAGGRQNAAIYRVIVDHLESTGHDVLTKHVARADVLTWEQARTPQEVYERDMAWLRQCDVVVAEVTSPSLGVGYEIAEALHLGKPVLCIVVLAYASEAELLSAVDAFLERTPRAG
jgi:nucleoside 2-deoxyribosyltransferase